MRTDKTTVFDLFQTQHRFIVPLFQRGYVWTRQRQWEPLWEDLVAQAAVVARQRVAPGKGLQKHFLGAVVLNLMPTPLRHIPVVEIIDGQQRLTTLQLMLCAIRDETAYLNNEYMRANLALVTANMHAFAHADERFKVWPSSALQSDFRDVIDSGSASELERRCALTRKFRYSKWHPPRPAIAEAYLFFATAIRAYLDDDPEELPFDLDKLPVADRAEFLVEALLRNIQLVTIQLEQEDDAQVIFETLNARGEPLTPSDLVRNFVFLTATRDQLDVADLYDRHWREYEELPAEQPFWKQEERQGRLKRPRLDLFLFHYVVFRKLEELTIAHLYQGFRDWWDEHPRSIETELDELNRYSAIYKQLLDPDPNTAFGRFAHRLRILDTSTAHPLILWAAGELGVDSPELLGMIRDLESFLVRRAVCGYNQKAYNRLFLVWLRQLKELGVPPTRDALRARLAESEAESAVWPGDPEFFRSLVSAPLYRAFSPRRTDMLLEAIELAQHGRYAEDIQIKSVLTVEHILPQNPKSGAWPVDPRADESDFEAESRRSSMLHTLGNLTLVTQPFNSDLSNGPYSEKRAQLDAENNTLLTLNAYFRHVDIWDEAAIETRGRKLAEDALKVWPGP